MGSFERRMWGDAFADLSAAQAIRGKHGRAGVNYASLAFRELPTRDH